MLVKSQNFRGEVEIPADFDDFTGYDGRAVKTVNCSPFAIRFGSSTDQAAAKFYDKYEKYHQERKKSMEDLTQVKTSIFDVLTEYMTQVLQIADPLVWEVIAPQNP